jgi:hypothetical protein
MRGLFANGCSLSLIFGHCFSSIPRALFLSETLFCPLSGLVWRHESFSCDVNAATTLRPLWRGSVAYIGQVLKTYMHEIAPKKLWT